MFFILICSRKHFLKQTASLQFKERQHTHARRHAMARLRALLCKLAVAITVDKNSRTLQNIIMRTDYINSKEYNKLYMRMTYENALALRTSLETGMRIGDVLHLKPSDIDGRTITYIAQKTNKTGKAVVSADLANRLKKTAGKIYVFEGRGGKKPRTRQAVWKDVKQASKGLFDENVAPHSARKTFAVETFHERGLPQTKKALQHERTDTTMLYAFADVMTGKSVGGGAQLDRIEKKIDLIIKSISEVLNKQSETTI